MEKSTSIIRNENGSIIVVALMVLVLLTLAGTSAVRTSNTEVMIARNDAILKKNLYTAEAVVVEGAANIENGDPGKLVIFDYDWLTAAATADDMSVPANWKPWPKPASQGHTQADANSTQTETLDTDTTDDNIYAFGAISKGIAGGSSLGMTGASQLHVYGIYGLRQAASGQRLIEIGYKRRF